MSNIILIISKIVPVILLIALGNFFQHIKFFKESTIDDLKKIIVNISLPALLFTAFVEIKFQSKYLFIVVIVFGVCLLMLFVGVLLKRLLKVENKYFPSVFSGFETGMMGYSIFVAIYGSASMYKLAVVDLGQVVFVFFILVTYLGRLNGDNSNFKELVISFIKSPIIISIFLGIFLGSVGVIGLISKFSILNGFYETIKLISSLTVPIICIVIGYELHVSKNSFGLPLLTALIRIIIQVTIAFFINTFLIVGFLHLDKIFVIAVYTMFILPPPFVIPIFMKKCDYNDKQFMINTISINIILSLIAYLIIIVLL
ncbi:AEC family transporter [Clostridium sp.]|uniref:AEC family transporter n=1 Tax=Clostridium sp. TaxID=1506 RepID=UPI001A3A42C3|nr:AEC family transporter [Clostridium sp.]MBK5237409.1 AEC family transporter [Clostridium sp.]